MESSGENFTVSRKEQPPEVHYELSGILTPESLIEFQKHLYRAAKPFIEGKRKFRVLGDMSKFGVQPPEMTDLIRKSQEDSVRLGMEKMAIIYSGTLAKMQFKRVSQTVDIEFFETAGPALAWLRQD